MNNKVLGKIDKRKSLENQLIQLFKMWKKEHAKDPNPDETCPGNMWKDKGFVESFIPDGCVNFEKYEHAKKKVLFLLKEPGSLNAKEQYIGDKKIEKAIKEHWYKYIVEEEKNDKYYKNFKSMSEIIGADLKETALMNINKRGGYAGGTNDKKLKKYAEEYKEYIEKQIEILNPDIIISCIGKGKTKDVLFNIEDDEWHDLLLKNKTIGLFKTQYNNAEVYGMYHPGYYAMSPENYRFLFEQIYKY